ncbi:MAG TPA: FtsX-like permease family protein [Thermoanaerobaculia bacterium]|nr:FtsX-like permease family protein [Thermoanaerobaculia bacterium]
MEFGPIFRAVTRHRARFVLIVAEVALTLALVANCVNLILDARAELARRSGFDEENLILVSAEPFEETFRDDAFRNRIMDADAAALRAMPGVKAVSQTNLAPWGRSASATGVQLEGKNEMEPMGTQIYLGDDGLLDALGAELVEGRAFTRAEYETPNEEGSTAPVNIIVSRSLADALFPEGGALGRKLQFAGGESSILTIVGVIDRFYKPFRGEDFQTRVMLLPGRTGNYEYGASFLVRTEPGQIDAVRADLESTLLRVDKGRNVRLQTIPDLRRNAQARNRMLVATLNAVMGLLLLVTALGIVGLTSFSVAERRRQIGTRRALGATKQDVLRYFLLENWLVTTCGAVLGVGLAIGLNIGLVNLVEGSRVGWPVLAAGVVLLWVVGLAAALGPALRAAQVPPAIATRNV